MSDGLTSGSARSLRGLEVSPECSLRKLLRSASPRLLQVSQRVWSISRELAWKRRCGKTCRRSSLSIIPWRGAILCSYQVDGRRSHSFSGSSGFLWNTLWYRWVSESSCIARHIAHRSVSGVPVCTPHAMRSVLLMRSRSCSRPHRYYRSVEPRLYSAGMRQTLWN